MRSVKVSGKNDTPRPTLGQQFPVNKDLLRRPAFASVQLHNFRRAFVAYHRRPIKLSDCERVRILTVKRSDDLCSADQGEDMTPRALTTAQVEEKLALLANEVAQTPRLSREALMRILAECYCAGLVPMSDDTRKRLIAKVESVRLSEGANRVYLKSGQETTYTLIVRYVFASKSERCNASRYTAVLTWLAAQNVEPDAFTKTITENGGLTAIYWIARNRSDKPMKRNKITLSTTISVIAGKPVTLRLLPKASGVFDVLEVTA